MIGETSTTTSADVPVNPNLPWKTHYSAVFGKVNLGDTTGIKHIEGVAGMTVGQLTEALEKGGKFVVYPYDISLLVITLRQSSPITFVPPGKSRRMKALKYFFISLLLGWWGIPWGFIFTPIYLVENLRGGRDVTAGIAQPLIQHSIATAQAQ